MVKNEYWVFHKIVSYKILESVFFFKKKKKCTTGSLKNKIIDKIVLLNRRLYINRRSYLVCIQDDENVARVAYCTKQDAFWRRVNLKWLKPGYALRWLKRRGLSITITSLPAEKWCTSNCCYSFVQRSMIGEAKTPGVRITNCYYRDGPMLSFMSRPISKYCLL